MSNIDIEKFLKDELGRGSNVVELHVDLARELLDRLSKYRERIQQLRRDRDLRLAPLQRELADVKRSLRWARERLDPEDVGTQYSYMDQCEVAVHLEAIEKIRGKIVAQRLLWGQESAVDLKHETIGVLQQAIAKAQHEEERWRSHLAEARTKGWLSFREPPSSPLAR